MCCIYGIYKNSPEIFFSWSEIFENTSVITETVIGGEDGYYFPYHLHDTTVLCRQTLNTSKPTKSVRFTIENGKLRYELTATLHIPFTKSNNGKVKGMLITEALDNVYPKCDPQNPVDRLLFKRISILRAFDPNICSCVDWNEAILVENNSRSREYRFQLAPPRARQDRPLREGGYMGDRGRCNGKQHGFSAHYATGSYEVDFFRCGDSSDMLVLNIKFLSVPLENPSEAGWRCNIYPATYRELYDTGLRGITWCQGKDCGTAQMKDRNLSIFELEQDYDNGK